MATIGDRQDSNSVWEVLPMWYSAPKLEVLLSVTPVQVYWGRAEVGDVILDGQEDGNALYLIYDAPDMGLNDRLQENVNLTARYKGREVSVLVEVESNAGELKVTSIADPDFDIEVDGPDWNEGENAFIAVLRLVPTDDWLGG